MKKAIFAAFAVSLLTAPAVAKKVQMSSLEMQQMQSKDYEAPKGLVFSSVMTVLQDAGYRINSADKDTGLITGTASTASKMTWMPFVGFGKGKKTPVVSAFIEEMGPNTTHVRLNFVMSKMSSNQFGSNQDEEPILDAAVYTDAFEKVAQALFVRQAMQTPQPAAPQPVPQPQ